MAAMKAKVQDLERDLTMERRRVEEAQLQLSESVGKQAELLAAREELVQMRDQCRKAEEKMRQVERESKAQLNGETCARVTILHQGEILSCNMDFGWAEMQWQVDTLRTAAVQSVPPDHVSLVVK